MRPVGATALRLQIEFYKFYKKTLIRQRSIVSKMIENHFNAVNYFTIEYNDAPLRGKEQPKEAQRREKTYRRQGLGSSNLDHLVFSGKLFVDSKTFNREFSVNEGLEQNPKGYTESTYHIFISKSFDVTVYEACF